MEKMKEERTPYSDLHAAVAASVNYWEVVNLLGLDASEESRQEVQRQIRRLRLSTAHFAGGRRTYSDDSLANAVVSAKSMTDVLRHLGLSIRGRNQQRIARRIPQLNLDTSHFCGKYSYSDQDLERYVPLSESYAQLLRWMELSPSGSTHRRVKQRVAELGLDTFHFVGQGWSKGRRVPRPPRVELAAVLIAGRRSNSNNLRIRLLSEGLKDRVCEGCGRVEWNGGDIPLELHHVKGRRDDNRFGNLKILCPNRHALTDSYRGRNIKKDPS